MEQKIWATGDSKVGGYLKLAQNYRTKHGSLAGFLATHGALIKDNGKTYKVRVDGERVKLANLTSYNAYQSLRQGKEGYNRVRKELLELGIPKKEVEAFIKDDKQQYKKIVAEVKGADAISAEPVQKGHVGSLQTGSPDVSGNIEPELRSVNTGKQGQSPLPEALLAEGRPRTSQEAFIRWKDSSGLPNPSDYTYEQRQALRAAQSVEEVDDLLTSFDTKPVKLFGRSGAVKLIKNVARVIPSPVDDIPLAAAAGTFVAGSALLGGASPAEAGEAFSSTAVDVITDPASSTPGTGERLYPDGMERYSPEGMERARQEQEDAFQQNIVQPAKSFLNSVGGYINFSAAGF